MNKMKQLYGRLDMVDLDGHEKYYGSLGMADPFTIETKQGNPILLDGTKERPFEGMRIFGKSTQDGTPSPDNPVPIVSAGDEGEINVEVLGGNLADISQVVNIGESSYVQISDTGFSFTYSEKNDNTRLNQIPCKLKKGKQYICTAERSSNYIVIYLPEISQYLRFGIAFTPNEDVNYIIVYVNSGDPYDTYTVEHFMVNVGDTALPWEPYKTPQSMTLSTPGGLPGIPVTSGGNYTDADGQQWVCDEIDLARGKYVQRVKKFVVTSDTKITSTNRYASAALDVVQSFRVGEYTGQIIKSSAMMAKNFVVKSMWNTAEEAAYTVEQTIDFNILNERIGTNAESTSEEAVAAVREWLKDNPLTFLCQLITPIETDLPAEEIAAYKALHTYSPTTTVSNDADTEMEIKYKKYPIGGMS